MSIWNLPRKGLPRESATTAYLKTNSRFIVTLSGNSCIRDFLLYLERYGKTLSDRHTELREPA